MASQCKQAENLFDYLSKVKDSNREDALKTQKEMDDSLIPFVSWSNENASEHQIHKSLTALWIQNADTELFQKFLKDLLPYYTKLSSLKITETSLHNKELISKLCAALETQKSNLTRIQIEDSKMEENEIMILCNLFSKTPKMERIYLSNNFFNEKVTKLFSVVLQNFSNVTHLHLPHNEIDDEQIKYLNIQKIKTLRNLDLSYNKLTSNVSIKIYFVV